LLEAIVLANGLYHPLCNVIATFLCATATTGCRSDPIQRETPSHSINVVPGIPADTVPQWVFADSNVIAKTEYLSLSHVKNVVRVSFMAESTQPERQAAIDQVHGVVIGGNMGNYYVYIRGATPATLRSVIEMLNSIPQVDRAGYVLVNFLEGN